MKELKNKNGITLIALVITIIVMLILVAVTISMAINGGLFEKAGEAVGNTKNELNKEQELANGRIKIDGIWYDSIDDYLNNKKSENQGAGGGGTEEEVKVSDLPTSIVTSDTTSSKLKVQVQKPEGLGDDVEYTYTIKKINSDKTETVVQTQTVKDTSYLFESLEERADYLIETSTSNINGTIYMGSCIGNTYLKLRISLPNEIYRTTESIQAGSGGIGIGASGGPGLRVQILARLGSESVVVWDDASTVNDGDKYGYFIGSRAIYSPSGYDRYRSGNCYIEKIIATDITR